MSGVDKFIPLAKCMGDILNEENYNLHYIGGSDLDFAGKGNFYRTHGFNSVEGWYELEDKLNNKNYRSPWGVYDDELFELIYERIQKLSEQKIILVYSHLLWILIILMDIYPHHVKIKNILMAKIQF